MPQYLVKQRNCWFATLEIPKALRGKLGKVRYKQTLQTDSLRVAELRKHALIAQWKAEIEAARGTLSHLDTLYLAQQHREAQKKSGEPVRLTRPMIDYVMAVAGPASPLTQAEKSELTDIASGKKYPLKHHLSGFEKSLTFIEAKTRDIRMSDVRRFATKFQYAESATNKAVREWVEVNLLAEGNLSILSCRKIISNSRQYWKYLIDRKDLQLKDPFDNVVPARNQTRKQELATKRKHFEADDYKKLLSECKDSSLDALIRIGAFTGCRLEEICSLTVDNVKSDRILIEDAKSKAGWRTVPLHDDVKELVESLVNSSSDGYLIPNLTTNKYGDRSNAIGKKFGRLKTRCGYGKDLVFHSFRKGVSTQLEMLGVSENITAHLLGHDIPTMTYGLYSGNKLDFTLLQDTINKLKWR